MYMFYPQYELNHVTDQSVVTKCSRSIRLLKNFSEYQDISYGLLNGSRPLLVLFL